MSESPDALLLKKRARRRLIGAVALVLFVVIVLPMVLDKDPKPLQNELSVQIPRQDSGAFKTRVLPQPAVLDKADAAEQAKADPPAQPSAPAAAEPKAATREPERPATKVASPKAEVAKSPEPSKKTEAKPPAAATGASLEAQRAQAALSDEAWMVPLGTFANPDNVRQLQAKVGAAGVKTVTEVLKTSEGEKIRLRGGPFKTKQEAEKARDSLKAVGLDAGAVTAR